MAGIPVAALGTASASQELDAPAWTERYRIVDGCKSAFILHETTYDIPSSGYHQRALTGATTRIIAASGFPSPIKGRCCLRSDISARGRRRLDAGTVNLAAREESMKTPATLVLVALCSCSAVAAADEQRNRLTAERVFLEKMGAGRFDKLDEIYGEGFIAHGPTRDFNLEEDNASGKEWRKACPDLKVTVKQAVADADRVAVHWNAKCTNTVAAAGLPGKGGKADVDGMTFFRFKDAKIVEEWSIMDIVNMMRQLAPPKTN